MKIGNAKLEMQIKYYRSLLGMTQRELASNLNVGMTSYIDKEKGRHNFTLREVIILLTLFKTVDTNVSFEALFMPSQVA